MSIQTTTLEPTDQQRSRRTAWIVWAILVAVTLAGWRLADSRDHGKAVVALIALIGFGKCALILWHFMETRHAPRWLQLVTTGWMAILWLTLLLIFVGT
jgi:Prokaryotic Cytochrome C oxidase subunit IV